jgi:hypothetical protein
LQFFGALCLAAAVVALASHLLRRRLSPVT